MKYYTVYKVYNLINDKEYIGKHETENPFDDYMGSGKLMTKALHKYGKDNFEKEVLYIFLNEQDMNKKEKELVNWKYVNSLLTYNLCPGGQGGFGYINKNNLKTSVDVLNEKRLQKLYSNTEYREYFRNKNIEAAKKSHKNRKKEDYIKFYAKGIESRKGSVCINKDGVNKFCKIIELENYLSLGWNKGMLKSSKRKD